MGIIEEKWIELLRNSPFNERILFTLLASLSHDIPSYGSHLVCYILYKFNLCSQYKIRQEKWPERELVMKSLRKLLMDSFISPFFTYFVLWPVFTYQGMKMDGPIPDLLTLLAQFTLFLLINDTCFYWVHRLLHYTPLYLRFHKQHHSYYVSTSIAAEYASPVEYVFADVLPTLLGPLLCHNMHPTTYLLWIPIRLIETLDAHSGYDFPFNPWHFIRGSARFHDYHHSHNKGNYGLIPWGWDYLMGTDVDFKNYILKHEKDKKDTNEVVDFKGAK